MRYIQLSALTLTYLLTLASSFAQTGGQIFTKNVAVIAREKFGKPEGSGDVWGFEKSGMHDFPELLYFLQTY